MRVQINNNYLSLRMTDEEAKTLVQALTVRLHRRDAMGPELAELKNWSDQVMSVPGQVDGDATQISISICAI